jgi:hypothetical protein
MGFKTHFKTKTRLCYPASFCGYCFAIIVNKAHKSYLLLLVKELPPLNLEESIWAPPLV